jgi:hypothetical protein
MHSSDFISARLATRLSPLVHLTNNWISLIGVILVTTAGILWLFVFFGHVTTETENPYIGIVAFLALPGLFFGGLGLIPVGAWLRFRGEHRAGKYPLTFDKLNFRNPEFRRLLAFIGAATMANLLIGGQLVYHGVSYMDGVTFCGQTCHTVMEPEFAAYQNSPHSRVECVKCHIGPGASWFVRSKLSGVGQIVAVTFNTYSRPIPTPVHNLRPARDTCEACHWPQKFEGTRLRVVPKYADDEKNTLTKTVLLMHIGGGQGGPSIHGAHLGDGVVIRYAHSDESRQTIPWVEYSNSLTGRKTTYLAADTKPEGVATWPVREMDCVDCHNRPTHTFDVPDRVLNQALSFGDISPALPYAKKKGLELLQATYASREEGLAKIPAEFENYYKTNYPEIYSQNQGNVRRGAETLRTIYARNIFPNMGITWGTYPNNIGHTDFTGCFRCHDDAHASSDGKAISQDCGTCHELLAMEEAEPKILTELGLTNGVR